MILLDKPPLSLETITLIFVHRWSSHGDALLSREDSVQEWYRCDVGDVPSTSFIAGLCMYFFVSP